MSSITSSFLIKFVYFHRTRCEADERSDLFPLVLPTLIVFITRLSALLPASIILFHLHTCRIFLFSWYSSFYKPTYPAAYYLNNEHFETLRDSEIIEIIMYMYFIDLINAAPIPQLPSSQRWCMAEAKLPSNPFSNVYAPPPSPPPPM